MSVAKEEIRQIVIEKTLSVTDVYSPLKELYRIEMPAEMVIHIKEQFFLDWRLAGMAFKLSLLICFYGLY